MKFFKQKYQTVLLALIISFSLLGCATAVPQVEIIDVDFSDPLTFSSAEAERDAIFSLAAYAVVFQNWQTTETPKKEQRGHNIGSILVNANNTPVAWGRNCIAQEVDGTQHGEVRVMQQYIKEANSELLDGYTIYTTLEPCIMCSGMMSLVKVAHCVYGQTDGDNPEAGRIGYGRAIERLQLDSSSLPNGYVPYPRTPKTSKASDLPHRAALDARYLDAGVESITNFLLSDTAMEVYANASATFYNYEVVYDENHKIYAETKALLETVK